MESYTRKSINKHFGIVLGGSDGKQSACNAGDLGSIPGLGRSSGEGNGNLLQYSCLENSMDRGTWWTAVHEVEELDTTEWLTHILKLRLSMPSFTILRAVLESTIKLEI